MRTEARSEGLLNTSRSSFHLSEKEPVSLLRQSTSWKPFEDHFFQIPVLSFIYLFIRALPSPNVFIYIK